MLDKPFISLTPTLKKIALPQDVTTALDDVKKAYNICVNLTL